MSSLLKYNEAAMNRTDRRRARLSQLVEQAGGTQTKLAEKMGTNPSVISQYLNSRSSFGGEWAARAEAAMSKPDGWLDQWLPVEGGLDEPGLTDAEIELLEKFRLLTNDVERGKALERLRSHAEEPPPHPTTATDRQRA